MQRFPDEIQGRVTKCPACKSHREEVCFRRGWTGTTNSCVEVVEDIGEDDGIRECDKEGVCGQSSRRGCQEFDCCHGVDGRVLCHGKILRLHENLVVGLVVAT